MKPASIIIAGLLTAFVLGFCLHQVTAKQTTTMAGGTMRVGAFSISLNVKDLATSRQFYEDLGFNISGGSMEKNYLIMKNEGTLIGLFQGMFQGNMLTFNPGWDQNAKNIEKFDDVREVQKTLLSKGIKLTEQADANTTGPAYIMLSDPDGNVILFDQHR